MNTIIIAYLGAVLYLTSPAAGSETKVSKKACKDMAPLHHTQAQNLPAPYTIKATPSEVNAGETVEVVISGNEANDTITGFLLQARHGDTPVGIFKLSPEEKFAQTLDCYNEADTLTHQRIANLGAKRSMAFEWTAPGNLTDVIKFRLTVALDKLIFWIGVESDPVNIK